MATTATNVKGFKAMYDGTIGRDVYIKKGEITKKIASPGDAVEVGDVSQGKRTLCRLGDEFYWIEDSAWGVE